MFPQNQLLKRYSQEHLVRAMCGTPCSRRQVLQLLHAMVCNDYGVMAHPVADGGCYISRQIPDCSDENCLTLFLSGWTADFPLSRALSCSRKNRAGYPPGQSVGFQFFFSTGLSQARVKLLQELSVPLLMIAQQVPVDVFKVKKMLNALVMNSIRIFSREMQNAPRWSNNNTTQL